MQVQASAPHADFADQVSGQYRGDVISDSRGSSRSDVLVNVVKAGPNIVKIDASYARIPARTFKLERILATIQNSGGQDLFLYDMNKSPASLKLTIDEVSWSGVRTGASTP